MRLDNTLPTDHTTVCLQLDFYGPLLTERSREVLDQYFACDLSLAEIAENLAISRQAVHDKVRQGTKLLSDYEQQLKLVERHLETQKLIDLVREQLGRHETDAAARTLDQLERALLKT
ncbi:MAG: DNA-binding protein [Clostridia bacterium]|nr:sigma factor-like helix-turn-helix DNA-binding protein [Eubacteriales bacterium]NCC49154.1 DNA-binding protein [Clostridia bacterium]